MILKLTIDDQTYEINVDQQSMQEAEEFYTKMDSDMDKGWQMSRSWVEQPDLYQRCQIVADRILGAFHTENQRSMNQDSPCNSVKNLGVSRSNFS